jgi:hypothetical protein
MEKTREISLTEQEWLGIKSIADDLGLSISEFLANLSSQKLLVIDPESREDELDLQEALLTVAEAQKTGEKPMLWEDFETQLENHDISN